MIDLANAGLKNISQVRHGIHKFVWNIIHSNENKSEGSDKVTKMWFIKYNIFSVSKD